VAHLQDALQSNDVPPATSECIDGMYDKEQATHPDWADPGGHLETKKNPAAELASWALNVGLLRLLVIVSSLLTFPY